MNRKLLLSILFLAFCIHSVHSTILHVNANVQGGNQDGTSWADAFPLLQSAIIAAQYGDTVWVAQGTYLPTTGTNRNISFTLKNGVRFFGGFTGVETALDERDWEANPTILSGDIGVPGDSTDNSYTVVYCNFADSNTVLDGFVIISGNADNGATSVPPSSRTKSGGGLYLEGSSPLEDVRPWVVNCRFACNTAVSNGGAVYMRSTGAGSCSPYFKGCVFESNHAFYGGAMYKEGGSLLHDMSVMGCRFDSNSADFYGGGLGYNSTNGNKKVTIRECEFISNNGTLSGGAFHQDVLSSSSQLQFIGCRFTSNFSLGGGVLSVFNWVYNEHLKVDKCDFSFNNIPDGAIVIYDYGVINVDSCNFKDNSQSAWGTHLTCSNANLIVTNSHFDEIGISDAGRLLDMGGNSFVYFTNCSIYRNDGEISVLINTHADAGIEGGIFLNNSIVFGNNVAPSGFLVFLANDIITFTLSHTLIDVPDCASIANGPVTCGPGNLFNLDPLFADTAASDFTLLPCSPAINAGSNAIIDSLGILTDIAGNPRIQGGTVDMGAYE
ncbi:MAG: hypothetical protein EPO28_09520, partial [Saprospiraceae bacterium]